jgi:Na+-driven multidrug efflux pump
MATGSSSSGIMNTVILAIRIASVGFVFMALSVSTQGVLQGLRYVYSPIFISLLRLAIFVFPLVFLFTLSSKATTLLWLSFPLSELLTAVISFFIGRSSLKKSLNQKAVQLTQEAN